MLYILLTTLHKKPNTPYAYVYDGAMPGIYQARQAALLAALSPTKVGVEINATDHRFMTEEVYYENLGLGVWAIYAGARPEEKFLLALHKRIKTARKEEPP